MSRSEDVEIDYDPEKYAPEEYAPWYKQLMKLSPGKRALLTKEAMRRISDAKPEAAEFIGKFKCILIGVCPRIEYTLTDHRDGEEESDVTWFHSFSMPTLLFWCPQGEFGFFVNANLNYNDTVLNKVKGNKRQNLRGFTA